MRFELNNHVGGYVFGWVVVLCQINAQSVIKNVFVWEKFVTLECVRKLRESNTIGIRVMLPFLPNKCLSIAGQNPQGVFRNHCQKFYVRFASQGVNKSLKLKWIVDKLRAHTHKVPNLLRTHKCVSVQMLLISLPRK